MTNEELERRRRAERIRAAKKRRHRKVIINRILAAVFLLAVIAAIIVAIIWIDKALKGENEDPVVDIPGQSTPSPVPTEAPTPTAEPTPSPTPMPTKVPDGVKRVAFTFDDGPAYNGLTLKFAEKLASYGGKGTWFIVGNRVNSENRDDLKKISEMGMEIGIHAWSHEYYFDRNPDKLNEELTRTSDLIYEITDKKPFLFRPPGGNFTDKQVSDITYPVILWSLDTEDWKLKGNTTEEERSDNVRKIADNIRANVSDGSIILMHEIYNNSYDAFCIAVDELSKEGYIFVTVSELIGDELRAGHKYSYWPYR